MGNPRPLHSREQPTLRVDKNLVEFVLADAD